MKRKFSKSPSYVKANKITNDLPENINDFLMDLSQQTELISYSDIMYLGNVWNKLDSINHKNLLKQSIEIGVERSQELLEDFLDLDIYEAMEEDDDVNFEITNLVEFIKRAIKQPL